MTGKGERDLERGSSGSFGRPSKFLEAQGLKIVSHLLFCTEYVGHLGLL